MALKEYKAEKLLYTMGEVTEMFDVKPSLIRFWVDRFDVLQPKKNKKGNRLFTPADVKNLEVIYHLTKERGMKLAGVEKYLKNNREEAERETEIVRRLQTIRSLLVEIREELKENAEGEVSVFVAGPSLDAEPETASLAVTEPIPGEDGSLPIPLEPETPNPLEFIEEVLPGEIAGDEPETDDFWSDEQAVEEMRDGEEAENSENDMPQNDESPVEGFSAGEDSFGLKAETEEVYNRYPIEPETGEPEPEFLPQEPGSCDSPEEEESAEWLEEEDVLDEEVSVPFTAQPLFELEGAEETIPDETVEESPPDEEVKPAAVDTQQSLF